MRLEKHLHIQIRDNWFLLFERSGPEESDIVVLKAEPEESDSVILRMKSEESDTVA